jgi:hypothetical protein
MNEQEKQTIKENLITQFKKDYPGITIPEFTVDDNGRCFFHAYVNTKAAANFIITSPTK